ncbi:homing endonuclease [Vibrio phage Va1]|nr:homing endonuclease [Vibrio phage Va1]
MKKYLRWYYNIINRAFLDKDNRNKQYHEMHHIKMKSLGGKMVVPLTPREHFLAHFIYKHYKVHGNTNQKIKSARAFKAMTFCSPDNIERYTSHSFEYARLAFNKSIQGEKHPFYGKKHTPETREKISKILNNMSPEKKSVMKLNMRKAKLGTSWSEVQRENILKSRQEYVNRRITHEILYPCGRVEYTGCLKRYIKDNGLSRQMIYSNGFGVKIEIKPGGRRTEAALKTEGLIINKLVFHEQ